MLFNQSNYEAIYSIDPYSAHRGSSFWKIKPDQCLMQPYQLPFPLARLTNTTTQMNGVRSQIIDLNGSFVLTSVDSLTPGGVKITKNMGNQTLELNIVGDMGEPGIIQRAVTQQLADHLENSEADVYSTVWGVGDWVYPLAHINDSSEEIARVNKAVFEQYHGITQLSSVYGVLGNHEYGDETTMADPDLFIRVANERQIEIPGRYYQILYTHEQWSVDHFALDTSTLATDIDQVQWLIEGLQESVLTEKETGKLRWRLVVGHHPINSSTIHKDENLFMGELLAGYLSDMDLFIAGHEHLVELQSSTQNHPLTFICGTASQIRDEVVPQSDDFYISNKAGFGVVRITGEQLSIGFKSIDECA